MSILGIVMLVVGAIIFAGAFIYQYLRLKKIINAIALEAYDMKKELLILALLALGCGIGLMTFGLGYPVYKELTLQAYEWACLVIGGLFLGLEFSLFFTTFRLHYYQKLINKDIDKWLYVILLVSVPLMILTLWLMTEGYAHHIEYPLYNGISWQGGLHFATAKTRDANLAWYAICIISGAVLVYFICDHFLYQEYGKHGLVDSTFLLAFPSGIIGARIFYVIGNWNLEFAGKEWWKPFAMWEGGLTILGGAITGIVVGVAWFMHKNKNIPIGRAINIIVPTILIAQAVGRWGNFFNCEVHGVLVDAANWQWLPTMILKQLEYSSAAGQAPVGQIYVPLFLIESMVNIFGYYVLFGLGKLLKKYVANGDLALGYIVWYGATRTFMEPLRDTAFNMGSDGRWSWIWSIIFIGVGVLAIIANHVVRYIIRNKKNPIILTSELQSKYRINSIIGIAICAIISFAIFGTGLGLLVNNTLDNAPTLIALVPHNIGLIMTIVGGCMIPSIIIPSLYLYKSMQKVEVQE